MGTIAAVPSQRLAESHRKLGIAWVLLCLTLALHVTDEALTGFLNIYNPTVLALRAKLRYWPRMARRVDRGGGDPAGAVTVCVSRGKVDSACFLYLCNHHGGERAYAHHRHDLRTDRELRTFSTTRTGFLLVSVSVGGLALWAGAAVADAFPPPLDEPSTALVTKLLHPYSGDSFPTEVVV
jgi:hypothetical protein